MTPKLVSLLFIGLWTALAVGSGLWSWRRWRRSRILRAVKTWFGDIKESDFPTLFALLSGGEILGVALAGVFALIGSYFFLSMMG